MKLDIILPTCNRQALLRRTLESVAAAKEPPGLHTNVLVIDNNSQDGTAETVRQAASLLGPRLRYLREPRQGKPYALNTGIAAADGDLIGLIDDDEEIDSQWFTVAYEWFQKPEVDFIGGPSILKRTSPLPDWVPRNYGAVISWAECGNKVREFGPQSPDVMLLGGNAVIRRGALNRCGLYATDLRRTHDRLLSGEDHDMYNRLLATGARGFFVPDLVMFHHLFPERLTKPYFRRWVFWHGVSMEVMEKRRPRDAPQWLGVPRWEYRVAATGAWKRVRGCFGYPPAAAFGGELDVVHLVGLLYGRHLFQRLNRPEASSPA